MYFQDELWKQAGTELSPARLLNTIKDEDDLKNEDDLINKDDLKYEVKILKDYNELGENFEKKNDDSVKEAPAYCRSFLDGLQG